MRRLLAKTYFPNEGSRRFEMLLFLFWAVATLEFSISVVGAKLFLIWLYGWTKVHEHSLVILAMPKGHPWPVSNGELISEGQHYIHFLITLVCWLPLFFITYLPLRRILPRNKGATA